MGDSDPTRSWDLVGGAGGRRGRGIHAHRPVYPYRFWGVATKQKPEKWADGSQKMKDLVWAKCKEATGVEPPVC